MRSMNESNVTAGLPAAAMTTVRHERAAGPADGVWTLADGQPSIVDPDGPATVLVPSEQVRVIAVDLPLRSRARRLEALPFAVEDQIADPVDSVHLALGASIGDQRYLVGVVRHAVMAAWIADLEAAGLDHAALVPDALALPQAADGGWTVALADGRARVRTGDGAGFAVNAGLLAAAWDRAGRPAILSLGDALPGAMQDAAPAVPAAGEADALAARLQRPPLDLRQGNYVRRVRIGGTGQWRRLGWIVGLGVAAHTLIAVADTAMLRVIADRREADTRALVALMAPGAVISEDVATDATRMLPVPQARERFLPLLGRVSAALAPVAPELSVRAMRFAGTTLTVELDAREAGLAERVNAALRTAGVRAQATAGPDGLVRIVAEGA